jgi:beta-N-acetylhexosaminidase
MIDLKGKPFYLNDDEIQWVERTLADMTEEEKIGQLFCLIAYDNNAELLKSFAVDYKVGSLMCRPRLGPTGQVVLPNLS